MIFTHSARQRPITYAPATSRVVLSATDVTKTFAEGRQEIAVLHGVSLAIERGEIVALEGPSGSGKTTLLSILGCILTPTSGIVTVDGQRVDGLSARELASVRKRSIGFVFQQYNLFPSLTTRENVEYALNIKGMTGAAARRSAEAALETVGLADRLDFLPRDLSGGQKQRVAIARAVSSQPPILLADEPTANLDSQAGLEILELFRRTCKQFDQASVIVTHDPNVRRFADRVVRIRDGRLS